MLYKRGLLTLKIANVEKLKVVSKSFYLNLMDFLK